MVSPYLPHALYAIAVTSLSIHISNQKKSSEEEKTRLETRISILQQVRDQLRNTDKPVSWDEIERLKKLARPTQSEAEDKSDGRVLPEVKLSWTDVFYGRKLPKEEDEVVLSEWDKKDLEKLKSELEGKS
ncbi:hypothetical protein EST38_g2247 [Candolleomyces aberdarensis]|uniref:Uncharacterized protein n=1 Tax=Candolleomyces aberdarensis TaxID=2316362 RepID=A0A4V1Q4X2_9AGAR|nr:hypothetical protein EST38_g2247 [Candolleomyces aberdarensis]